MGCEAWGYLNPEEPTFSGLLIIMISLGRLFGVKVGLRLLGLGCRGQDSECKSM